MKLTVLGSLEGFLSQWDAWMVPVTVGPAFAHRKRGKPLDVDGRKVPYQMGLIGNTSPFYVTGSRVVVLPVGRFREGLPIGVQLVRRRWHDMGLLQVAELVEAQVTGPFRPPAGYSSQPRPTGAVA